MTSSIAKVDLTSMISNLSLSELNQLKEFVEKEQASKKAEIEDTYGPDFCGIVGTEKISALFKVTAKDLNLENDGKYAQNCVKPSMLQGHSAVRGIMGSNRPFIAIKIDILDPKTKERVDVVVEVVFKRYALDGSGGKEKFDENNYVTTLITASEAGKQWNSFLYATGGMTREQIAAVGELLDGKEIKPPYGNYLIRMSV
ncbi:MAG: hypothetical protein JSR46_10825 [Verrucomicrobia bacterium]|nr:hypothetical protein [Verrucomicrobiota bacterium]